VTLLTAFLMVLMQHMVVLPLAHHFALLLVIHLVQAIAPSHAHAVVVQIVFQAAVGLAMLGVIQVVRVV